MPILTLTLRSLLNRKVTVFLTVTAIAFSITLLLGVEKIRSGARSSFQNTISGTDLIIGARTGPTQLLLYAVFRIGNATNNISWESYQDFVRLKDIKWTIPLSLGDSHRGYRVLGTTQDYFQYFQFGQKRTLEFVEGRPFQEVYDAVLGAEVARKLKYQMGQKIVLAHGVSEVSFFDHADKPFRVVGILKPTGTPVDQTIHVSLQGIEAIHIDWQEGVPPAEGQEVSAEQALQMNLQPKTITAFLVGLQSKFGIFKIQRAANEYREEPLMAVLPGATLQSLWRTFSIAENSLRLISIFVVLTGLMGMLTALLTSLNERRREMAILRSVGARPWHIFGLLVGEALFLALMGGLLGVALLYGCLFLGQPWIERQWNLFLPIQMLSLYDCAILGGVVSVAVLIGFIPAWQAYRHSLADGLTIRI